MLIEVRRKSRNKYGVISRDVSRAYIAEHEAAERPIFSSESDSLTRAQANKFLENIVGIPCRGSGLKLYVSLNNTETFQNFGEDDEARLNVLRMIIREGANNLVKNGFEASARWVAVVILNGAHPSVLLIITSQTASQKKPLRLPSGWASRESDNNYNKATTFFAQALIKHAPPVPPLSIMTRLPYLDVRNSMPERADTSDLFGQSELNKAASYLLHERQIAPRIVEEALSNGSIYVSQQGLNVFVHRDTYGQTTGFTAHDKSTNDPGYFYVGDPCSARCFILTSSPIEALSLYHLTANRALHDVCFIALRGARLGEQFVKQIAFNLYKHIQVRVIWALALRADEESERANQDAIEEELYVAAKQYLENSYPDKKSLDVLNFVPRQPFGSTWNNYLLCNHKISDEIPIF
jgi:hypothetical protein